MHFLVSSVHNEEHYPKVKFHEEQPFFHESIQEEKRSCIISMFK